MKKIIFCGGGSAGHVMPNVALYENLCKKYDISYLGTDAIEKDICKNFSIPFRTFYGVKFERGKLLTNLKIPAKLKKSIDECKKILDEERPDLLFCKGGYASLPPALAAAKLNIPVLTHESDLTAGLANKIIARRARRILTSFPPTAKKFSNGVYTGTPMRESLFGRDAIESKRALGLDLRPAVLVFGGGSGSQIINAALRESLFTLSKKYNVLHVCGRGNAGEANLRGYRQLEFCDDMGLLYSACDYAVARCGSNSAHELIALRIPTLFIPLENSSTRGDQVKNAEYFYKLGLCRVLRESDLCANSLVKSIEALMQDAQIKTALSKYSAVCGNRNIEIEIEAALK